MKYTLDVSNEVAVDFVIDLSPAAYPDKMNYGSEITMVVSTGEKPLDPVAMPNVKNISKDQALTLLQSAGFVVAESDITYVNDASVPANTVIWQSIAADTPTVPGTAVQLRVSTGYSEAKVQIQLPTQMTTPIDIKVYVKGELKHTFTGLLPNEVQVKDVVVSEQLESYTVTVHIADNGKGNFAEYAKYTVNGKTGEVTILKAPDQNVLTPAATPTTVG